MITVITNRSCLAFAFLISSRPQIRECVRIERSFLERRQRAVHARISTAAGRRGPGVAGKYASTGGVTWSIFCSLTRCVCNI